MTPDTMRLRLKHVTVRRNKDRSLRYYFRRRGYPLTPLPDDPTTPEFMAAYQACLSPAPPVREKSLGWLADRYMDSHGFTSKSKATRDARRRIILTMMAERLDPKHPETFGMERLERITPKHIAILRDRKGRSPNAANERMKVLSQIFKFAIEQEWREDNPVRDVRRLAVRTGGHDTATDEDIAAYEAKHVSGPARRAMVLLKAFGMRVSDLRILGPQHVRKGLLTFETVKTGVLCELTIDADARREVEGCRDLVFLTNEHGSAFASDKALSQRIAKWFRQAGVESVTAHGVRKWRATKMAENGASEYELMSWFGWKDPKEARPYVQAANRRKLAKSAGEKMPSVTREG